MASGGSGSGVSIERREEEKKRLEDRICVLEASKAALDQAAKSSGGQRAFIPGLGPGAAGKVLSQPPRPGSVYFCVQNTSALRSDVARQGNLGNLNSNGKFVCRVFFGRFSKNSICPKRQNSIRKS